MKLLRTTVSYDSYGSKQIISYTLCGNLVAGMFDIKSWSETPIKGPENHSFTVVLNRGRTFSNFKMFLQQCITVKVVPCNLFHHHCWCLIVSIHDSLAWTTMCEWKLTTRPGRKARWPKWTPYEKGGHREECPCWGEMPRAGECTTSGVWPRRAS